MFVSFTNAIILPICIGCYVEGLCWSFWAKSTFIPSSRGRVAHPLLKMYKPLLLYWHFCYRLHHAKLHIPHLLCVSMWLVLANGKSGLILETGLQKPIHSSSFLGISLQFAGSQLKVCNHKDTWVFEGTGKDKKAPMLWTIKDKQITYLYLWLNTFEGLICYSRWYPTISQ